MSTNGVHIDIPPAASVVDPAQAACIQLLEQVLATARAGDVRSVCIVACGPGGFGASFAGPDAPQLNLGLDSAKASIMQAVLQPQKRSSIIRPVMGR